LNEAHKAIDVALRLENKKKSGDIIQWLSEGAKSLSEGTFSKVIKEACKHPIDPNPKSQIPTNSTLKT
jgi:hypothetical protein